MLDLIGPHVQLHVYQLSEDGPAAEELDSEDMAAANNWILPCREFQGLWESLIYDADIKASVSNIDWRIKKKKKDSID